MADEVWKNLTICYWVLKITLMDQEGKIIFRIAFVASSLLDGDPLQRRCGFVDEVIFHPNQNPLADLSMKIGLLLVTFY